MGKALFGWLPISKVSQEVSGKLQLLGGLQAAQHGDKWLLCHIVTQVWPGWQTVWEFASGAHVPGGNECRSVYADINND